MNTKSIGGVIDWRSLAELIKPTSDDELEIECLRLHAELHLSAVDIAAALKLPLDTVKGWLVS